MSKLSEDVLYLSFYWTLQLQNGNVVFECWRLVVLVHHHALHILPQGGHLLSRTSKIILTKLNQQRGQETKKKVNMLCWLWLKLLVHTVIILACQDKELNCLHNIKMHFLKSRRVNIAKSRRILDIFMSCIGKGSQCSQFSIDIEIDTFMSSI